VTRSASLAAPSPKCSRGSGHERYESLLVTSRIILRPPASTVTRVPIAVPRPGGTSQITVSQARASSRSEQRGRRVEIGDQQVEVAVVVVVADREPAPHCAWAKPGPA
jgi:hypothetical protein